MTEPSLQERFAPDGICFGCGPANEQGLHIRSHPTADREEVVAEWQARSEHQAFPGFVSGGIIGTVLDCHSNWTAAHHLMESAGRDRPPTTVTADYAVRFLKPAPVSAPLTLRARVVESTAHRVIVEATLAADGEICATCRGTFVAVRPGHPAFDRW